MHITQQFCSTFPHGTVVHISSKVCRLLQDCASSSSSPGNHKFVTVYSLLHAVSVLELVKSSLKKKSSILITIENFMPIFLAQNVLPSDDPLLQLFLQHLTFLAEARMVSVCLVQEDLTGAIKKDTFRDSLRTIIKQQVHRTVNC